MGDRLSVKQRSLNMAAVKSSGNKSTEQALVKLFRVNGVKGWRRRSKLVGRPDFVFPRRKVVIFADGCFWHGCRRHKGIPETNRSFWVTKIDRNIKRDKKVNRMLRAKGLRVLRMWEHDIKKGAIKKVTLALK